MLIEGYQDQVIETEGGLGESVRFYDRPDLTGTGPGYVTVTRASGDAPPPPPIWGTVVGAEGIITIGGDPPAVPITCPDTVDGFEVYAGNSPYPPAAGAPCAWTASGSLVIHTNVPVYLYARSARGIMRSVWVPYAGQAGTTGEWTLVYSDDPIDGADDAPYPDCAELPAGYDHIYHATEGEAPWHSVSTDTQLAASAPMLGILTGGGVRHGRHFRGQGGSGGRVPDREFLCALPPRRA